MRSTMITIRNAAGTKIGNLTPMSKTVSISSMRTVVEAQRALLRACWEDASVQIDDDRVVKIYNLIIALHKATSLLLDATPLVGEFSLEEISEAEKIVSENNH